jgi:PAS domain S-box-containing protein
MTEDELLNTTAMAITHPEDRRLHREKRVQLMAGQIANDTLEKRYIRKDGSIIWVNLISSPIRKQGEVTERCLTVVEDITERKRAELETATIAEIGRVIGSSLEIEEVYDRFAAEARKLIPFDRLSVSLYNLRNQTVRIAYVSGQGVASREPGGTFPLPGSYNESVMQTRRGLLVQPAHIKELAERFPSLVPNYKNGVRSMMSVPLISRDTVIGGLHFRSRKTNAYAEQDLRVAERIGNQIAGAIANAQLFGELKKTEGSLRESEAKYRELIDLLPISIFEVDAAAKISTFNRAALSVFGYTELDAEEGLPASRFFTPGELERVGEHWQKVIAGSAAPSQEFTFVRKDGSTFPGLIYVSRIIYENKYAGVRGAIIDITLHKQMEEEHRKLEERLGRAEKMEALGTLAGGVAHDLNNVLGVLVGYGELLQEKIPEGSPLRRYATHILQSGLKGAAIIQDLLTLARRGVAIADVVQLNRVVADYLKSPEFENLKDFHPKVRFRLELDTNLLPIKGSPVHLGKTVMNLISNAAESVTGAGEVTIRTENRYLDRPIGGYDEMREGDYALLTVADTGQGISPQDLGKIFEPFYTKKVMGRSGTGLGLAVVWGTVKDHNGTIDVTSREGAGSLFSLYFPVTREGLLPDREAAAPESYQGRGETILVVDDVKEQRELAVSMLTRLGYRVEAVPGGEEALAFFHLRAVDLVVLDMIMDPGMDGLETYRRIAAIHPRQKAIIVSGFSETDRVREAQTLGAGAYVRKPYVLEKIGIAIRNELDGPSSSATAERAGS